MSRRVLVAPAPLREIEFTYGPILRGAGYTIEYPPRDNVLTEQQMSVAELLAQLPGCVASLAGSEPYTREVIAAAAGAGLKVIARAGVGYDAVDLQAATDHGVAVCYAPGTNQDAVAEHAFMLMLALSRKLREQDTEIRAGLWPRRAVGNLRGQTLGIVGLGRIGKAVAKRAVPFDLNVIATEIEPDHAFAAAHNVKLVPLEELLKQSDIVTLHVPKTPLTKNLINRETLALMKPTAFVLNTSRGGVVHEKDLYEALVANKIAGAGLDVYEVEPPKTNPLFGLDNIILTAHTAGVDQQSRQDMARLPANAIVKLLAGEWPADWIVNPQVKEKFFARAV
ncbi:phosphoglycerate dehydrogenase [Gemmata sp. G18]|uniref:Phosphoglycerate dehydrogenase n=1 Tax=Gemmata palustris TaxID=2822762 RepID=A0ABS5BMX4_9BACT|nr:phosphoglycerate dehydrogenase [Gemmata palustris]MBP3955083.1 phosphoglycerate dehydrogenase [Gemmata palustris]